MGSKKGYKYLEGLERFLSSDEHLRKTTLVLLLGHRIHGLVYLDCAGQTADLSTAHQMLAHAHAGLEEVCAANLAATLRSCSLAIV